MVNQGKVPSVYSYSQPTAAMEQQWGGSVSPDAVAMVHTKLELDLGTTNDELDIITQSLDGMGDLSFEHLKTPIGVGGLPQYTYTSAEEIVTDYLVKVFEYVRGLVDTFSEAVRGRFPTDIVITIPTV